MTVKVTEINRKLSPAQRKLKRNLARAQRLVRKHVKAGRSLVDELIAERRGTA